MTDALERFIAAKLYVITCRPALGAGGYEAMIEAACQGGAEIVQFRDKTLSEKDRCQTAVRLHAICVRHGVLFIVNDSLEVALAVGADGVHLGQDDLPVPIARSLAQAMGRRDLLIGCSTHSLAQAQEAQETGADYIGVGPVFATPTKPAYEPVGIELVREVSSRIRTPQVAIGGIDVANVEQVLAAGAERVAVVRAVCGAADVARSARELKDILERAHEKSCR